MVNDNKAKKTTAGDACGSCIITRRQALALAAGVGVLAMVPVFRASADTPDQWVEVGKSTDFTKGTPVRTTPAPSEVVFVTRVDDKTLVAVSAKCTHHGCEVAWTPLDSQFECPCHGAAFGTDGKNVHGTRRHPEDALPPLLSLPVREHNGSVVINVAGIAPILLAPSGD